jgi:hypothetical protein
MSDPKLTRKQFIMLVGGLFLALLAKSIPTKVAKQVVDRAAKGNATYGTNTYGGKNA